MSCGLLRGLCRLNGGRGRFGRFDAGEHFDDAFAIAVVGSGIDAPEGGDFFGARAGKFLFEFAFALQRKFVGCFFLMLSEVVENVREAGVVPVNPGIGGVLEQFFIGVCVAKFTEICVNEFFPPDFRPCAWKVFCPQVAVALKGQIEMVVIRDFEDAFECVDEGLAVGHGSSCQLSVVSCPARPPHRKGARRERQEGWGGCLIFCLSPFQLIAFPKLARNMRKSGKSTVPEPSRSKVALVVPKACENRRKS